MRKVLFVLFVVILFLIVGCDESQINYMSNNDTIGADNVASGSSSITEIPQEKTSKYPSIRDTVFKSHPTSNRVAIKFDNAFYDEVSLMSYSSSELIKENTPENIKKVILSAYDAFTHELRYNKETVENAKVIIQDCADYVKYDRTCISLSLSNKAEGGKLDEFYLRIYVYDPETLLLYQEWGEFSGSLDFEQNVQYTRCINGVFRNSSKPVYILLDTWFNYESGKASVLSLCKSINISDVHPMHPRILGRYDCNLDQLSSTDKVALFELNPSSIQKEPVGGSCNKHIPVPKPIESEESVPEGQEVIFNPITVINGDSDWTDSGVYVKKDQKVSVSASGVVSFCGSNPDPSCHTDPNGNPGGSNLGEFPCQDERRISNLIGRIGTESCFNIGSYKEFIADRDGILYLRVNDYILTDNSGSWNLEIKLS